MKYTDHWEILSARHTKNRDNILMRKYYDITACTFVVIFAIKELQARS